VITGTWRSRAAVLVSAVGLVLPLGGTALADHGGGPSTSDVAAGRAAVHDREAQVRAAVAAVTRAQGALDRLSTAAEVAVERYNGARVREQQARAEVNVAQVVVNAAAARVDAARARVSRFGRAAYMGGGMSSVDVLLTSSGPSSLLYRIGTLEVISSSQRDAMQSLEAARIYQLAVEKQAQAALDRASAAAKAAVAAKSAAQNAVAHQADLVTGLQTRRHELAALLRDARRHASALEQARLAAIARQQGRQPPQPQRRKPRSRHRRRRPSPHRHRPAEAVAAVAAVAAGAAASAERCRPTPNNARCRRPSHRSASPTSGARRARTATTARG